VSKLWKPNTKDNLIKDDSVRCIKLRTEFFTKNRAASGSDLSFYAKNKKQSAQNKITCNFSPKIKVKNVLKNVEN